MLGTHLKTMLSLWPSKIPINVLVKGSVRLSTEGIFSTTTSPLWTISQNKWYFLSMFLPFWWFFYSLDYSTPLLLSQNSIMGCTTIGTTLSSIRNFLIHTTSFVASKATMHSLFIVELIMQYCFTLLQLIVVPPKVKTKLELDQWESLSN